MSSIDFAKSKFDLGYFEIRLSFDRRTKPNTDLTKFIDMGFPDSKARLITTGIRLSDFVCEMCVTYSRLVLLMLGHCFVRGCPLQVYWIFESMLGLLKIVCAVSRGFSGLARPRKEFPRVRRRASHTCLYVFCYTPLACLLYVACPRLVRLVRFPPPFGSSLRVLGDSVALTARRMFITVEPYLQVGGNHANVVAHHIPNSRHFG